MGLCEGYRQPRCRGKGVCGKGQDGFALVHKEQLHSGGGPCCHASRCSPPWRCAGTVGKRWKERWHSRAGRVYLPPLHPGCSRGWDPSPGASALGQPFPGAQMSCLPCSYGRGEPEPASFSCTPERGSARWPTGALGAAGFCFSCCKAL